MDIYDKDGLNIDVIRVIKEEKRGRIKEYLEEVRTAEYNENFRGIWEIPCDVALPCATQNELDEVSARELIKNGVICVAEGANMPSTKEAVSVFLEAKIPFGPGKAANAGGVACSGLEMSQNSMRYSWSFDEVDMKIKNIMENIFKMGHDASKVYGDEGNLVLGSNIAGFLKVYDAMVFQGIV